MVLGYCTETEHVEQYVLQFPLFFCPQANKCKLSNHVGTDQQSHTHARCLHYFNFHPRGIIAKLL